MSNEQPGEANNEDKKVIEEEEREKMLNAENKKKESDIGDVNEVDEKADDGEKEVSGEGRPVAGEVMRKRLALEEANQEAKGRGSGKIPTGGIRMPGFLRPKSRDKAKDGDIDLEEGADLLKENGQNGTSSGGKATSGGSGGGLRSLLSRFPAIPSLSALPNVRLSLPPFARKCKNKDVEAGQDGTDAPQAGLASVETLEDNHVKENGDDGMENIKLDGEEKMETNGTATNGTSGTNGVAKGDIQEQDNKTILERIRNYEHKYILGGLLLLLIVAIIVIIAAIATPQHVPQPAAIVEDKYIVTHTSCGPVEGLQEDGAYAFRGIPFARPPVGDLRWKPAQPLEDVKYCWKGTYKAHNSSTPCWQMWPSGSIDGSEDCLTLDIFTNKVDFDLPLPVVVVVGSTHITGGSTQMLMMPSAKLARAKEVVFVRINFRLGVLGFLTGRALSKSVHPPTSGNYGLSDIHAALLWINRNIDKFGGDKNAVTVLGYRSGATLVTALATSSKVKGLMKRAWVTSGSADFPGRPLPEVESQSQAFIDSVCGENVTTTDDNVKSKIQAECLRSLAAEELLEKTPREWRPSTPDLPKPFIKTTESGNPNRTIAADQEHQWLVLDGDILREHPSSVLAQWALSGTAPIQIVIGATAHADATIELYESLGSDVEQAVKDRVRSSILSNFELADEALRRYNSTWLGLARLVTDLRTVCPLNALFMKMLQTQTYFYIVTFPYTGFKGCGLGRWSNFPKRLSGKTKWPAPPVGCEANSVTPDSAKYPGPLAELGIDVAAIMGRVEGSTPEERRYVQAITRLFYNFVRDGEPHQATDPSKGKVLNVNQDTSRQHDYPHCGFWIKNDAAPHYGHRN